MPLYPATPVRQSVRKAVLRLSNRIGNDETLVRAPKHPKRLIGARGGTCAGSPALVVNRVPMTRIVMFGDNALAWEGWMISLLPCFAAARMGNHRGE